MSTAGGSGAFLAELDTFIGRETVLAELRSALPRRRLISVIGTAGVGKTRLCRHLMNTDGMAFSNGAHFVDLTDITRENLAVAIAQQLGITNNSPTVLDRLVTYVHQHPNMLLLLDNCQELVAELRPLVMTLLRASTGLRILVTSRTKLGVAGEEQLHIEPLPLEQAVQLLIDRGVDVRQEWARVVRAGDGLSAEDLAATRALCSLLQGLPLAIEMTAGWLGTNSPQELVADLNKRLEARLELLVDEHAEQPDHRSMVAALDSSYALLESDAHETDAQMLWQVAAVFAGGFDLAAASAVAQRVFELDRHQVRAALTLLVRHSVLTADTSDGGTRYLMLDTTRAYGHTKSAPQRATRAREAHAEYFAQQVATADADGFQAREDWTARLLTEMPNLRVAREYLHQHADRAQELAMVVHAGCTLFQMVGGHVAELRRWQQAALSRYPDEENVTDPVEGALKTNALALGAWMSLLQGAELEWKRPLQLCRQAAHAAGLDDPPGLLFAEATRVWLTEARATAARESIGMFRRVVAATDPAAGGNRGLHFLATQFAALSASFVGSPASAHELTRNLTDLAQTAGASWCQAWAGWAEALCELLHGKDLYQALGHAQDALAMAWKQGDTWLPGQALWLIACINIKLGHHAHGMFLLGGAAVRQRSIGMLVDTLLPWTRVQSRMQKTARAALGEEEFAAQLTLGAQTALEKVIDDALQPPPDIEDQSERERRSILNSLNSREVQIATLLTRSLSNRKIATELMISVRTVEHYVGTMIKKFDATDRVEVARTYQLLTGPDPRS